MVVGRVSSCFALCQEAIKFGLEDSDHTTRHWARKAFWAYADVFSVEADSLLFTLNQQIRAELEVSQCKYFFLMPSIELLSDRSRLEFKKFFPQGMGYPLINL